MPLTLLLLLGAIWVPTGSWWRSRFGVDDSVWFSLAALPVALAFLLRVDRGTQARPSHRLTDVLAIGATIAAFALTLPHLATLKAIGAWLLSVVVVHRFNLPDARGAEANAHPVGAADVLRSSALALVALPSRPTLDVTVGWPLRLWSADMAAWVVGAKSSTTLLAIEGRTLDVNAHCAGIESLQLTLIATLALAALVRAPLWRCVLATAVAVLCVTLGNAGRIIALTALARFPDIAALLHQPMGVLVVATAVALVLWLLPSPTASHRMWALSTLKPRPHLAVVVGVIALWTFIAWPRALPSQPALDISDALPKNAVTLPLTPSEHALLDGASAATKFTVTTPSGVPLQALWVYSTDARHHHEPERCLAAGGLSVARVGVAQLVGDPALFVHRALLHQGQSDTVWVTATDVLYDHKKRVVLGLLRPEPVVAITVYSPTSGTVEAGMALRQHITATQQLLRQHAARSATSQAATRDPPE